MIEFFQFIHSPVTLSWIQFQRCLRLLFRGKKKFSQLRETDDQLFPQTTAETRNFGKIKLLTINKFSVYWINFFGYKMIQESVVGCTGRMVLPFESLTISFKDVQCFVDTHLVMKCNWWFIPSAWEMRETGFSQKMR